MNGGSAVVTLAGETLLLHPQRAVLWPTRRTVVVADTHIGKSALFRQHGLAVPAGTDARDRLRLTELVREARAQTLVILGDFLHGPLRENSPDAREFVAWRAAMAPLDIEVVAGNHDRGVLKHWQPPVRWREGSWLQPPFLFTHDAGRAGSRGDAFVLSGHLHPVMRLGTARRGGPRVPVFWRRERGLVLPSFGLFTGGHVVSPAGGEEAYAIAGLRVVRIR